MQGTLQSKILVNLITYEYKQYPAATRALPRCRKVSPFTVSPEGALYMPKMLPTGRDASIFFDPAVDDQICSMFKKKLLIEQKTKLTIDRIKNSNVITN